ncbi:hypothetical protein ACWEU6_36855 [Streptosporangium sandarakinum]|uniref:hypothetical protein n=1 Tax=Streptosporangium sandarakinum TaxID=1260955 RepID=UPI00368D0B3F
MPADGRGERRLEVVEMAGAAREDALWAAVRDGTLGWLLPVGLADGPPAMRRRFLEVISALAEQAALCAMAGLSAPLVVQDRDGRLVAVLHAVSLPPAIVVNAADRGVPFEVMIAALTAVVKIRAVAVDEPSRGQGIGSALLTPLPAPVLPARLPGRLQSVPHRQRPGKLLYPAGLRRPGWGSRLQPPRPSRPSFSHPGRPGGADLHLRARRIEQQARRSQLCAAPLSAAL